MYIISSATKSSTFSFPPLFISRINTGSYFIPEKPFWLSQHFLSFCFKSSNPSFAYFKSVLLSDMTRIPHSLRKCITWPIACRTNYNSSLSHKKYRIPIVPLSSNQIASTWCFFPKSYSTYFTDISPLIYLTCTLYSPLKLMFS